MITPNTESAINCLFFHFAPVSFYHSYFLVFRFVDPPIVPFLLTIVEVRTCIGGNGDLYFNGYFLLTEAWTLLTLLYLRRIYHVFLLDWGFFHFCIR